MSEMTPRMVKHAVQVAKDGVHAIMKTKVELARMGALTGEVDKYMTAAGAELGALVMGADRADGILFMLDVASVYHPQYAEAIRLHSEEFLALEAEELANLPQDK